MYLLFFILWIIFNGRITVEVCAIGLIVSFFIYLFVSKFMDHSFKMELGIYKNIFKIIHYIFVLIKDVYIANLRVLHLILTQKEEIEPTLVEFKHDIDNAQVSAFLSNAITLTPGTITVNNEEGKLLVHCLDESLAEGFKDAKTYILLKEYFDKKEDETHE